MNATFPPLVAVVLQHAEGKHNHTARERDRRDGVEYDTIMKRFVAVEDEYRRK